MPTSFAAKEWTVAVEHALDPTGRRASAAGKVAFGLLTMLACAPLGGDISTHDVVVRRRADGAEVLRRRAFPDWLAEDIRWDLKRMSQETFLAKWLPRSPE
ncbi:MAG: hypothetical protein ABWX98_00245 [Lacisediminihabitans sp.]